MRPTVTGAAVRVGSALFLAVVAPRLAHANPPAGGSWAHVFSTSFVHQGTVAPWIPRTGRPLASGPDIAWYTPNDIYAVNLFPPPYHFFDLRLEARRETVAPGYPYTSAWMDTCGAFEFQYGYLEANVQVPPGDGFWPAFWALQSDLTASYGEIDVMEMFGDAHHNQTTVHTGYPLVHTSHVWPPRGSTATADFAAASNTFGADWEPDAVTFYVDGVQRFRTPAGTVIPAQPMYLLLDLAVGGAGGDPSGSVFPNALHVLSVDVWQHCGGCDCLNWRNRPCAPAFP
jgi:hypothetical protein